MSGELVARAQRGDRDAFGELVRLYTPMITGAILSRSGRFKDVEDMVQETFLRAFQGIGGLRDADRAGAWLYGIAMNVVRERRRAQGKAEVSLDASTECALEGPADTGVDGEALTACLEKLPENLREMFILRHIQGMSYKELGQLRNATVSSVGERLWKARGLLRTCMEGKGALSVSSLEA